MSIYYFLISDRKTKQEVGNYTNASKGTIQDFTNVKGKAQELLNQSDTFIQNSKYKILMDNHCLYHLSTSTTFYLTAVPKTSILFQKDHLIFDLIKEIEHQGLRKLVDSNDELTLIGSQYLKYSITKCQNNNPESSITPKDTLISTYYDNLPTAAALLDQTPQGDSIELHERRERTDLSEKEEVIQTPHKALTTPINLTSSYVENYNKTLIIIKIVKALILFVAFIVAVISFYYALAK